MSHLFGDIHLNPIKIIEPLWKEDGIKNLPQTHRYLKDYWYSSYLDYIGIKRLEVKIINKEIMPADFANHTQIDQLINDWLMA